MLHINTKFTETIHSTIISYEKLVLLVLKNAARQNNSNDNNLRVRHVVLFLAFFCFFI